MALLMDKACDISAFADVEESRYALGAVFYDRRRRAFVATDSRALAIVQEPNSSSEEVNELPHPDRDLLIPSDVLKDAAADLLDQDEQAVVTEAGDSHTTISVNNDGLRVVRTVEETQGRFPKWFDVLPRQFEHTVAMDPHQLLRIASYFAKLIGQGDENWMTIRFNGPVDALEFSAKLGDGRYAHVIAMPLSSDEECSTQVHPTAYSLHVSKHAGSSPANPG